MPDLVQSLQGRDLGHLRIIAELWDVDFNAPDARVGLQQLTLCLLNAEPVQNMMVDLPDKARLALDDLIQYDGRLSWSLFTRRYGAVREMGPAARDRQHPYGKDASPAEMLWYRALIGRAFFDTTAGPEEFAYIPEDLLPFLIPVQPEHITPPGRPATPVERAHQLLATDYILDEATSLLAALRVGFSSLLLDGEKKEPSPKGWWKPPPTVVQALLKLAGLLDPDDIPLPEPTRDFLESPRRDALALLVRAWLPSADFNELRQIPGLRCEGGWQNDPLRARHAVLDFLSSIEPGKWWSLPAFLTDIRQRHPDFQRTAGDYDSWYIRDEQSGEYLRGFDNWNNVDGALVHYLITGPLYWLGMVDLACPTPDGPVSAFRYSAWATDLLQGEAPADLPAEDQSLKVDSSARLSVPRLAPRSVRYQVARFVEWDDFRDNVYHYHLSPASLALARQQGLKVNHLLALLHRHAGVVPPNLTKALDRWEQQGVEARVEQVTVLRLSSPELLQSLRVSRAARFLGDPLGPTVIIVKPGAAKKVLSILAEMGYLGEIS